jgi:protein SHQ1
VVEDGRERATYDAATGRLVVCIPKAVPGQHFPDLDLLSTLLAPKRPAPAAGRTGIQVLSSSSGGKYMRMRCCARHTHTD